MHPFATLAAGGALLSVALSATVAAQDPPLRRFAKPDFEYAEPFSCISGLRELSDGRIVVADQREKILQIINLRTGATVKIGREGQGPGEWALPAGLFAGAGDTTLLWDQGNARVLPIHPNGTTGKAFTPNLSSGSGMTMITVPRGVDRMGRIYLQGSDFTATPGGGPPVAADSLAILRYDPASTKLDTLGFLRTPKADIQTSGTGGNRMVMMMAPNPMLPQATWTVSSDGRIAILHPEPYHLEWLSPSRTRTVGPTIRHQRLPVTQADKEAPVVPNNCRMSFTMSTGPGGGGRGVVRSGAAAGGGRGELRMPAPRTDWPEYKPPFLGGGRFSVSAVSAPNGDIWVLRTRAAGDDLPVYDIFDARGQVTGRMALPKGARFLAFGNGTVYLSRMDDDDLLYIQRYRIDQAR